MTRLLCLVTKGAIAITAVPSYVDNNVDLCSCSVRVSVPVVTTVR